MKKSLIFIGLPGSGKTWIGKMLATQLGIRFFDLDQEIEKSYGKPCREIYSEKGALFFRNYESHVLINLTEKVEAPFVLSTGGGIIEISSSVEKLQSIGSIIYLKGEIPLLFSRMTEKGLPAYLNKEDPFLSFEQLAKKRVPLYEAAADDVIDTAGKNVNEVVQEVLEKDYGG